MKTDSRFRSLIIYTDGSLMPEGAGAGVVVQDTHGQLLHIQNQQLQVETNNEAEYAAVALALQLARQLQAELVEIRADSEVVINQMRGEFAVKSYKLKPYHWQVCQLAQHFPRVRYTYVPREQNALADTFASEASMGRLWSIGAATCTGS